MRKLTRGTKLQEVIDAAVNVGCVLERSEEDRTELHFCHPTAGSFVLRKQGPRSDYAPFALIKFVNRAIES